MSTKIRSLVASFLLTFNAACPDNGETTDSNDDTGVSETGTAPTTGAETGETPTTGDDSASTSADASTSDASAGSTSQDGETGDEAGEAGEDSTGVDSTSAGETGETGETGDTGEVEILPGCVTLCEQAVMCELVPDVDDCAAGCSEAYASPDPACVAAGEGYLACLGQLDCAALIEAMDGDAAECADEADALSEACVGVDPVCSVGQGGGDGECGVDIECEGAPKQSMTCDDTTCTCFVDDVKTGECAADDACLEIDALVQKSKECCEF